MSKNSSLLFNLIAPIYGLFYDMQKSRYGTVIDNVSDVLDLTLYDTVLDVGCGTGALCSVLKEKGLAVTGIDPADKMLRIAKRQPENKAITFIQANVLESLPFENKTFDISIASYVAHGLQNNERKKMYAEMSRVSKSKVIIYDYNQKRGLLTSIIEWLERGDYFHFIKVAKEEMEQCVFEMNECFSEVKVVDVDAKAAWYICTPI
ncbi:class I SAM-dependent methyltransferase [Acetobacterium sp.]|uniref:class I SAM-dependent methyltransferase n=1 Tax=Acetobacterium sp. TaxID=1872094 RepID=UPI0035934BA0